MQAFVLLYHQVPVTVWKVTAFASPLMFTMTIQRISRPLVNLLVSRLASSKCAATEVVVLIKVFLLHYSQYYV